MYYVETIKTLYFHYLGNIYFKDLQGRYLACNLNQLKLVHFSSLEEILNKTDYDLYSKNIADRLKVTDTKIIQTRVESTFEEEGINCQGEPAIYLTKKIPLYDANNQVIGIIGSSFDITKEKQAALAKNDFLSNMAHDLRTPFSGISGIADLLYQEETDPEKKYLLELLNKSCKQWEKIHHRIFDALSGDRTEVKLELFPLKEEIQKIKEMMLATLYQKNLTVELESFSQEEGVLIKTDRLKFHSILLSLIGNAVKFTEKGKVWVKPKKNPTNFTIEIGDTGIGIPTDKLAYISDKFTKLSYSNRYGSEFKGMGLGPIFRRNMLKV